MLAAEIELASLRAWPAMREERRGGWVLRSADGYTKRANSATLLDGRTVETEHDIAACEVWFDSQGLPPIFRLPSYSTPPGLDAALDTKGYRRLDPTLVLHRTIEDVPRGEPVQSIGLNAWLGLYCELHHSSLDRHRVHRRILQSIASPCLYAALGEGDGFTACGLGVLDGDRFGLFDLVTSPQHRRQGLGTRLVSGMLEWARARGATRAYLQVVEHNDSARHLYHKLGFGELYRYWYRRRSEG